jgi:hypothetical protein
MDHPDNIYPLNISIKQSAQHSYGVTCSHTFPWTTEKGVVETGWTIYEDGSIQSSFPDTRSGGATWIGAYVAYIWL